MAFLQHGAACLRGLTPLTRAAAGASKRASRELLRCSPLLIRGSEGGGTPDQSSSAKQEEVYLHTSGSRYLADLGRSHKRKVAAKGEASTSHAVERTSDALAQRQVESETKEGQNTAGESEPRSIADIYGPYDPPSGFKAEPVKAFATTSGGGLGKSTEVKPNESAIPPADPHTDGKTAEPIDSPPQAVSSFEVKGVDVPGTAIRLPASDSSSPLPERFAAELDAGTNITSSIGVPPSAPGPSGSDSGAYAAFSAFAVIPLLLILLVSWLTYSGYRSKRRPLEIKVGRVEAVGDLEAGNGRGNHKQRSLIQQIVERLPQLKEVYKPFPGLTNQHVETIFAAFFRTLPDVRFRRECLAAPDGGTVALDWPVHGGKRASDDAMWGQELPPGSPVLILLPGLTGGSGDTYVRHMLVRARRAGFNVVVFNSRGCADSPVTSPQFYSASFTDDMRMVVAHVQRRFPDSKLLAVGWSLGANILVRYLGQEGSKTPIAAAASLCNPFDLVKGDEGFRRGFGKVYDSSLAKSLNRIYKKHAALFEGIGGDYDIPLAATAKTVRDFDEGLTRVCFGFPSVDEYYKQSSSINNIQDVAVPLMCIQAEDDPIAPNAGIPREKIEANPNTFLVVTPAGGHLGWIAGEEAPLGAPWTDPLVMDFFTTFLELQPSGRRDTPGADEEIRETLREVESPGEEALELSRSWNKR